MKHELMPFTQCPFLTTAHNSNLIKDLWQQVRELHAKSVSIWGQDDVPFQLTNLNRIRNPNPNLLLNKNVVEIGTTIAFNTWSSLQGVLLNSFWRVL